MATNEVYRFKVGRFTCLAVWDGTWPNSELAYERFEIPHEQLAEVYQPREDNVSTYTGILIDTGEERILIDTGVGADGLPIGAGRLLQNLQSVGVSPDTVDWVVYTHGDGDHIGGGADDDGQPVFPNARYVMNRIEWEHQTTEEVHKGTDEEHILFFRSRLLSPQKPIELIEEETEILPGVRVIPAYGHRPGHMAVTVSSDGEHLLVIADAVLYPFQIQYPHWRCSVDDDPAQAVIARQTLLKWAAEQEALILACHFDFPGLGRMMREGDEFRWQPLDEKSK